MMNVVEFLSRRQIGVKNKHIIVKCLRRRIVPLHRIVDPRSIHGHVILGFSQCGCYLLSYTECIVDIGAHEYTLHWWTFNLYHPISHLSEHTLFSARDLDLVVCLTPDLRYTLVHGSVRKEEDFNDRGTCHVALLPGPGRDGPTIRLQYERLPPCPAFLAHLALQIPGCVLLNTGDKLVAVHYDPTHKATHTQWFCDNPSSSQESPVECSPSHLLSVTVLQCSQFLLPSSTTGGVWVGQTVLDVEEWTNRVLPSEMSHRGLTYHCLLDYDLELVQVCVEKRIVIFVMVAFLEVSDSADCRDSVTVEVVGTWNVCDGVTIVKSVKSVTAPTSVPSDPFTFMSVTARATSLRAQANLLTGPQATVRSYSNHSVFSGHSLKYIHHPLLPVTLALTKNTFQ